MALKAYMTSPQLSIVDNGAGLVPNVGSYAFVFDGTTLIWLGGSPLMIGGNHQTVSTDTAKTVRTALSADAATVFNSLTGRTDGSSIKFIWLDDIGGLLGGNLL